MACCRSKKSRRVPVITPHPPLDQSKSASPVTGIKTPATPIPNKSSPSKIPVGKTTTATSPPKYRGIVPPIKIPSPQTADTNPHSHSRASATANKEKVNMRNENPYETKEKTEGDTCAICLDDYTEPKQLDKCGHTFCTACIDYYFQSIKPQCPCCFTIYGELRGNQPENGRMTYTVLNQRLPGFGRISSGTIQITYSFPGGIQDENHPNPGVPYDGTHRDAYLPDNQEGRHVLHLLERAFKLRQTFTIGQSRTTGCDNVVTWNDIHHKTSMDRGMENFGYPDKTYLNRVQQELAAKGIE